MGQSPMRQRQPRRMASGSEVAGAVGGATCAERARSYRTSSLGGEVAAADCDGGAEDFVGVLAVFVRLVCVALSLGECGRFDIVWGVFVGSTRFVVRSRICLQRKKDFMLRGVFGD